VRVFTFISSNGDAIPIAQRIVQEGHRVQFYINNRKARRIGDGLVDKHKEDGVLVDRNGRVNVQVLHALLAPNPDCIVFDCADYGFGTAADTYRKRSIPVIGGCEWGDRIELDLPFSKQVMNAVGIPNQPLANGIAITTELWFNGKDAININHTLRDDRLMEGGKGPKADMGNVMWLGSPDSKLFQESLGKLIPLLQKIEYIGPLALELDVSEHSICGKRFKAHFNYSTVFVLLEMLKGRINDLLYSTAVGISKALAFKSKLGISIKLAIMPEKFEGTITGLNKYNLKHFWGYDVRKEGEEYIINAGGSNVGTVTARGDEIQGFSSLRDAKRRAMRTVNNIKIVDVMYRLDIGNTVERERTQLKKWGWL